LKQLQKYNKKQKPIKIINFKNNQYAAVTTMFTYNYKIRQYGITDTMPVTGQWWINWLKVSSPRKAPQILLVRSAADPVFTDRESKIAPKNITNYYYSTL